MKNHIFYRETLGNHLWMLDLASVNLPKGNGYENPSEPTGRSFRADGEWLWKMFTVHQPAITERWTVGYCSSSPTSFHTHYGQPPVYPQDWCLESPPFKHVTRQTKYSWSSNSLVSIHIKQLFDHKPPLIVVNQHKVYSPALTLEFFSCDRLLSPSFFPSSSLWLSLDGLVAWVVTKRFQLIPRVISAAS